jgi:hypothetical protein
MTLLPSQERFKLFGDAAIALPPLQRLSQVAISNGNQPLRTWFAGSPDWNHGLPTKPPNRVEGLHSANMYARRVYQTKKLAYEIRMKVPSSESFTTEHNGGPSKRFVEKSS